MKRALVAIVTCALFAGLVRAEDREAAERSFRTAEKAYRAQNFEAAARHYDDAYQAWALPEIAFSAAQAYRKQYRVDAKREYVERAITYYKVYLKQVKTGGRVSDAADNLGEMESELAKLDAAGTRSTPTATGPRTQLAISPRFADDRRGGLREVSDSAERGVEVTVTLDGKPIRAFDRIDVEPGPHAIHVEAPGYLPADATENAIANQYTLIEVPLVARPAHVRVTTESGAQIRVDGQPMPGPTFELPAGPHTLAILRRGRQLVVRDLPLTRGQELEVRAPLTKTFRRRLVPWLGLAAAGLFVIGTSSAIYAQVQDTTVKEEWAIIKDGDASPDVARRYDDAVQRRDAAITATWGNGIGVVLIGGAALALYYFDSPSVDGVQVTPVANPGTAGATVVGTF